MVVGRATMLDCDGNTSYLSTNEFNTLCIGDTDEWAAFPTGFFYGFISDDPTWSNPNNNNYISFNIGSLNGIYAVLIGTNFWTKEKAYYLPSSGDGNFEDWDASIYGDLIRINISEIDGDQITISNTTANSYEITTTFQSTFGTKVTNNFPEESGNSENSSEDKYTFSTTNKQTVTRTITIKVANLVYLGDIDLIYCDDNDLQFQGNNVFTAQGFNVIDEQSGVLNWWDVIIEE